MVGNGHGSGPRTAFAERFALLYAEAGDPPLKRVTASVARSRRVDEQGRPVRVTAQRVSDWRRGRNVPARFSALSVVLEVLIGEARKQRPTPPIPELHDLGAWRELWEQALASPVAAVESAPPEMPEESGVCPYRGLAAFQPEDSSWFFGRERSTAALVARLDNSTEYGGIVVLVGASGAGKSSLVRAGLIPSIREGALADPGSASWPSAVMTPGAKPLAELVERVPELASVLPPGGLPDDPPTERGAGPRSLGVIDFAERVRAAVAEHARARGGERLVLVVDQFEEAFTLCGDDAQVQLFVQALAAACTPERPGGHAPALVVLGVRADFYGRCLVIPELADALQERQMVLGPMTTAELREAVARPARAAGLQLEAGLVELMLRDLGVRAGRTPVRGARGAYDAGALPLLSHALLATWQRRQAGRLTTAGYRAAGGIQGAVAATAERAWADLPPAAQGAARPLLLRLVRIGADTHDTRRRSTRQELVGQAGDPAAAEEALEVLARARLVTLDAGSVEITHEALIQAWPRLRDWIDQDREGELLRQRLEEDAAAWAEQGRDPSLLYRGARLEAARHWAARHRADGAGPTGATGDFLAVSGQHHRRAVWALRGGVALVVVLALIAGVAAVVAVRQRDDAVFRQVVAEADKLLDRDPSLSAQLALVARGMRPSALDLGTRLISSGGAPLATPLTGHTGAVYLTTFSPDGRTLATASYDRTVRLWDVTDRDAPKPLGEPLTGHGDWVSSAVFSPDGRTLASAGKDGSVRLWDVTDRARPRRLGTAEAPGRDTVYLVAFSPDGRTLASAHADRAVRLWDVTDPSAPRRVAELAGHGQQVRTVAFSPGGLLASGSDDATVRLWDVSDPSAPRQVGAPLGGFDSTVHSVAFSPDGRTLAAGSEDRSIRLWDVTDPAAPEARGRPLALHLAPVWSVAFSPDGRVLASGAADSTARLWNVTDPARVQPLGKPLAGRSGTVFAVGFSPDGRALATGSLDPVVRLWSLPSTVLVGHAARTVGPRFTPDGRALLTGSEDGTVRAWDLAGPGGPDAPAPIGDRRDAGEPVRAVVLGEDGRTMVTAGPKAVRLWDVRPGAEPEPLGAPLPLRTRFSSPLALRGNLLVTADEDNTVLLWDLSDRAHPRPLGEPLTGHDGYVNLALLTSDGRFLVTGSADSHLRVWDVSDPARPRAVGRFPGHDGPVRAGALSPDGRVLATAGDDKLVRLWDFSDPTAPRPLGAPLAGHEEAVVSVVFTPDGRTLASGGEDARLRLWDTSAPALAGPIGEGVVGHDSALRDISVSPDGSVVATSSADGTVRLWHLDADWARRRICARTGGVLTEDAWREHVPQLDYAPPCR
ncbi:WD40 repeat domain-containing protein [Actinosynnema pretiosum]|uniref:WD40 repeat domain-containing protein n=1 Tax=Actinosynnema pretiosum TaxID=42197 RepID=UPI0015A600EB|nr:WD40 repeat domain-containing protein [Actinosynnema pretiosum]